MVRASEFIGGENNAPAPLIAGDDNNSPADGDASESAADGDDDRCLIGVFASYPFSPFVPLFAPLLVAREWARAGVRNSDAAEVESLAPVVGAAVDELGCNVFDDDEDDEWCLPRCGVERNAVADVALCAGVVGGSSAMPSA